MKRVISLVLCMAMVLSLAAVCTSAVGSSNLSISLNKTDAEIGELITVTLSNNEMSVASFAGGIEFDTSKLECISIVGANPDYPSVVYMNLKKGMTTTVEATSVSNVEEANANGTVGFVWVATEERDFVAATVATITLKVKAGATGTASIKLYENSDGADGYKSNDVNNGADNVTIKAPAIPVAVTGVTLKENKLTLTVGATATLTATVTPDDATNTAVEWTSSDESVATVNNGTVTAIAEGTAVITVTTKDGGFTATCAVTVNAKPVPPKPEEPDEPATPVTPVIPTYTVTVPADIAGGTVTVSNTNPEQGEVITITAAPNYNYKLTDVIINGVSYGAVSPISYQVYGDLSVTAVFTYVPSFVEEDDTVASKPSMYDKVLGMAGAFPNYTDVLPTDWFYNNVLWAWSRNILDYGVSFAPNANATRATIVEWIWRMEGRPVVSGVAFDDTSAMSAAWAASAGIVNGYGNGKFGPDDLVTREQLAAILYRYANYKGINTNARGDLSRFSDAAKISDYAVEPMQWAVGVGMINGYPNGTVAPQGNATRAELTALLNRMSVWYGI